MNLAIKLSKEVFPTITLATKGELNKYVDKSCMYIIDRLGDN
jgi:hypothetical protein